MTRRAALLAAALAALAPATARAHEVLHDVERGRAVAVRAHHADEEPLADAPFEVYSPADPKRPYQTGRTDRSGWLAFVPDVPGRWRVKVVDGTGHGVDLEVDAAPGAVASSPAGDAAPRAPAAFVLRPLVGLAAIAAVFGLLFTLYRRKGTPR